MRLFKTKWFARFARKEDIKDCKLSEAIREIEKGQIDAVLGGGLIKKRIPREGGGKSGGYRTIIAYKSNVRCLFLLGFAKSTAGNIDDNEFEELKKLAHSFLGSNNKEIAAALKIGRLEEVEYDDQEI